MLGFVCLGMWCGVQEVGGGGGRGMGYMILGIHVGFVVILVIILSGASCRWTG